MNKQDFMAWQPLVWRCQTLTRSLNYLTGRLHGGWRRQTRQPQHGWSPMYVLLMTGTLIVLPVGSEISYTLYWLEIKHWNSVKSPNC